MSSRSSLRARPVEETSPVLPTGRAVRVTLPDGRRAELWLPGGLATAKSVRRLALRATRARKRRAQSLQSFGAAAVAGYQAELRKQQRTLQRQLNVTLEADSRLNARVTRALVESRRDLERLNAEARRCLARFEKKTLVDPALVLSSLPLVSLYGRHNTQHHLTLVIVLAIWLFGDEVTELLSSPRSEGATAPVRSDFWLYLSPVANLVAGWWLLHERQHEPYITGTASEFERVPRSRREREETAPLRRALEHARSALLPCLPPCLREGREVEQYRAVVELAPYVAKDFELDLVGLTEPPSLATVRGITWSAGAERRTPRVEAIAAWVEVGKLYLTLTVSAGRGPRRGRPLVEEVEVAWLVKVLDEAQLSRWI